MAHTYADAATPFCLSVIHKARSRAVGDGRQVEMADVLRGLPEDEASFAMRLVGRLGLTAADLIAGSAPEGRPTRGSTADWSDSMLAIASEARNEAARWDSAVLGLEHLLLAAAKLDDVALARLGLEYQAIGKALSDLRPAGPRRSKEVRPAAESDGGRVTITGRSPPISVLDFGGNGRLLVLVHGAGRHAGRWREIGPAVARIHRVVAIDVAGHGGSPWDAEFSFDAAAGAIGAVVDWVGADEVVVAGHSLGGHIALRFAATDPRCAGVACLDGPTQLRQVPDPDRAVGAELDQQMAAVAPDHDEELTIGTRMLLAMTREIRRQDVEGELELNRGRALFVLATNGDDPGLAKRRELATAVQAHAWGEVLWKNGTHLFPDEDPAGTVAVLRGWLSARD